MATFACRVQFLDDTDPFNSTNFPEPTRPPYFTFREDIPLINQIAGVHRLLKAPHKLDDCALQLSHNGSYLDLESTLAEQRDELEGFQEDGGRGKKHSIVLRTQLSVRVHACIEKLYNSTGRELRRALFSLKQIFQDDKDLVHEFVMAEGLTCLIKVGAEADQNYQNYILRVLRELFPYNPITVAEPMGVPRPSALLQSSRSAQINLRRGWRKKREVEAFSCSSPDRLLSSGSRRKSPRLGRQQQQNLTPCTHKDLPGEVEDTFHMH
ncbi:FH1/FH2 domain-containing protein 3-like [Myxocyprinus asiaticus]|uniref:FH1/FH2 domain-containing protein 3-like n=1 Tax=Myxocyprinus asiaticus TaxID=70543 RepID=UPI0022215086|nr:FH1/FH2 domain-containing protein 3-like [Myxocyprinus asiaticus]